MQLLRSVLLLALGLAGGSIFKLYTQTDPALERYPIQIITSAPEVDEYLYRYEKQVGNDMEAYRNHCYRVLSYAMHFLARDGLDDATRASHLRILGAALAYHDLGIWSDARMDYLEPSIGHAQEDLPGAGFSSEEIKIIADIIEYHHKLSPFQDPSKDYSYLVEAVRRADTLDFTLGVNSMGMPRAHINAVSKALPNAGFHAFLAGLGFRLYKWDLKQHLNILTIYRK